MKNRMIKRSVMMSLLVWAVVLLVTGSLAVGEEKAKLVLPDLQPQASPQAVVDEHLAALNAFDWGRLMAQFPPEVEIHLPDGVVVKGRDAVAELFDGFCKPQPDGGLKGGVFMTESSMTVGDTLLVQWVFEAPFLTEPYRGSDAYVTKDGLMYGQVTTFNGADLKFVSK